MAAGVSGGNYDPPGRLFLIIAQRCHIEGSDFMYGGMANLSINDFQPQIPTLLLSRLTAKSVLNKLINCALH